MRLQAAASMFNKMACHDAYSGALLFRGQIALYDDNKRDSETTERRVVSVAPGTSLPVRRAIEAAGTHFILGHGHSDDFRGKTVRVGYVAHEATYLSHVRTLAQVCLDQDGFTSYAGRAWVKNLAASEQESSLAPQSHVYFAQNEPVPVRSVITFGGRLHVVRSTHLGPSGMLVSTCDELSEPAIEMASVVNATYDPILDTVSATPVNVRVLRVRWQSLFSYDSPVAPKFGPDDLQVVIAKATMTVKPGATVTLSDGAWHIASVQGDGDVWLCRATRHG